MFGLEPLTPAYGRDYKSLEELKTDFYNNKDFMTPSGRYTSFTELLERFSGKQLEVRFNKLRDAGMVTVLTHNDGAGAYCHGCECEIDGTPYYVAGYSFCCKECSDAFDASFRSYE